jgi:hypothetical protein
VQANPEDTNERPRRVIAFIIEDPNDLAEVVDPLESKSIVDFVLSTLVGSVELAIQPVK